MPATQNFVMAKGKNAAAAITKKRFVKLDTAAADGETVKQCDVAGEGAFGVALVSTSLAEIAKGKGSSVLNMGIAIVEASAALAVGVKVATDANGKAKAATAGNHVLGSIVEPSTGDTTECSVMLDLPGNILA